MSLHGAGADSGYNETEINIGMSIILSEEQKGIIYGRDITTHNAVRLVRRWPNGRIPYTISRDPSSHEVIKRAVPEIPKSQYF